MPTKCKPCSKDFADSSLGNCPECGSEDVYQWECECNGACDWYCE